MSAAGPYRRPHECDEVRDSLTRRELVVTLVWAAALVALLVLWIWVTS